MSIDSLLRKVAREPGLCSLEEIQEVKKWIEEFNENLNIYSSVYGEPHGHSVEMNIVGLSWYEEFHSKKQ